MNPMLAMMPEIRMPSVGESFVRPQIEADIARAFLAGPSNAPRAMPGSGYGITPSNSLLSEIQPSGEAYAMNGPSEGLATAYDDGQYSWLRYANQGATRDDPLSQRMTQALASFLPEMGVEVEVFSGGQGPAGSGDARTGSTRHDHGNAADVFFHRNGRRLSWENPSDVPVLQEIVRRGRAAGLTGFGAGPGYMTPGSMHIGFGAPAVWGDGGRSANAPDWLREAYYG